MKRKLDDWVDSYLAYQKNTEPPDLYKEWVAYSVIASVLQRKCLLPWGDLTFYPNMYVVLVGPSGRCRKGTAMNPGEVLLHSSLTIYSQELTVFLGYNNMALMSDLTDWYDCRDRWTYRTKNMGTDDIIGVWVNLIGATTPELIQTTLPRDAIGGGLTSRIIFVYEDKKGKLVPAPFLSPREEQLREDLILDLERIGSMRGEFKITTGFLDKYVEWYVKQSSNPPFEDARFSGYNERRANHLLKLCMILSASSSHSLAITEKEFDRAIGALKRVEKKMPMVFSGVGKSETSDVLSRVMLFVATKGETSFKEVLKNFYYDADKDAMTRIVGTLCAMGFCTLIHRGKEIILKHNKEK